MGRTPVQINYEHAMGIDFQKKMKDYVIHRVHQLSRQRRIKVLALFFSLDRCEGIAPEFPLLDFLQCRFSGMGIGLA